MKRALLLAVIVAAPSVAAAQSTWQIGGNLGVRTRADGDHRVNGTQLEAMFIRPARGRYALQGALAWVQMRNETPTGGAVRENSFEATLFVRRPLASGFGIAAGPAIGISGGCASGGTGGITYGAPECVVSFADKGTVRPGYAMQLDFEHANARGAVFRAGVRAVGHTVASGSKTPKPGVWAGFSLPLVTR